MLKLYVHGYLNRIHSRRRLERESQRNVELTWLTGRLSPDFKTIATLGRTTGLQFEVFVVAWQPVVAAQVNEIALAMS